MEMTNYASKGVANAGLATGIIGTSLGALNAIGGLGALSGVVGGRTTEHCINEDHCVNRYELNMTRENDRAIVEKDLIIAQKDSELALAHAKENTRMRPCSPSSINSLVRKPCRIRPTKTVSKSCRSVWKTVAQTQIAPYSVKWKLVRLMTI